VSTADGRVGLAAGAPVTVEDEADFDADDEPAELLSADEC
jgi:hypothetical protein